MDYQLSSVGPHKPTPVQVQVQAVTSVEAVPV
jgi:hypothetical protein